MAVPASPGGRPRPAGRHSDAADARRRVCARRGATGPLARIAAAVKKQGGGSGHRGLPERVKTARGRKVSSQRWLERQLNDPYVARSKQEGYRSRAAYKLIE